MKILYINKNKINDEINLLNKNNINNILFLFFINI